MSLIQMTDLDLSHKRVLIREDFNVPMSNGKITSDARIVAALPTISLALKQNAAVILMSHLGRPKEGSENHDASLVPVAEHLSKLLEQPVRFIADWLESEIKVTPGEVVLCENVRLQVGEKANEPELAKKMAALCDIFVMDAFGTAHRAQASTHGIAEYAPISCAGPLLVAELNALGTALQAPKKPLVAIVGGAKVSTKLQVLQKLVTDVDYLILGGGIANTFLAACEHPVGKSLYEPDLLADAKHILALAKQHNCQVPIPVDVVTAKEFSQDALATEKAIDDVAYDDLILDIGSKTAEHYAEILADAATIVWNGPVGVFELAPFSSGTKSLALSIAESSAFSIAGGGDTLAAIDKYGIHDEVSYISTGGGAFLEFLEGKVLPAVAMLEKRAAVA